MNQPVTITGKFCSIVKITADGFKSDLYVLRTFWKHETGTNSVQSLVAGGDTQQFLMILSIIEVYGVETVSSMAAMRTSKFEGQLNFDKEICSNANQQ